MFSARKGPFARFANSKWGLINNKSLRSASGSTVTAITPRQRVVRGNIVFLRSLLYCLLRVFLCLCMSQEAAARLRQ